jgi:hypothetical protein
VSFSKFSAEELRTLERSAKELIERVSNIPGQSATHERAIRELDQIRRFIAEKEEPQLTT